MDGLMAASVGMEMFDRVNRKSEMKMEIAFIVLFVTSY